MHWKYGVCFLLLIWSFGAIGQDEKPVLKRLGQLFPDTGSVRNTLDVWGYCDSTANKEYALIGSGGLAIVDVTEPGMLKMIVHLKGVPDFDIKTWKHYMYLVDGSSTGKGSIYDISTIDEPEKAGYFPSAHNIWIDERGYLYAEDPGLRIYDLNFNPAQPELVWEKMGDGHDVFVKGDILYDFHGHGGTFVYNVTDPSNPVLLCEINDPAIKFHHSGWITEDDRYLFICDEGAKGSTPDFTVWDISDYKVPVKINSYLDTNATIHNLYIIGDYAYVSYYSAGFRIFDISTPADLFLSDEYKVSTETGTGFMGTFGIYPFAPSGNFYISDRDSGLMIFSFLPKEAEEILQPLGFNIFELSPNPNQGEFKVVLKDKDLKYFIMRIYDMAGRVVFEEHKSDLNGFYSDIISIPFMAKSVYWVSIDTNFGRFSRKMVVTQ